MTDADLADVWARSLDSLANLRISPSQLAWLKLTRPLGLVENTALIATPNAFVKDQLETRLRPLVTHALSRELGRSIQLAVTVDPAAGGLSTQAGQGQQGFRDPEGTAFRGAAGGTLAPGDPGPGPSQQAGPNLDVSPRGAQAASQHDAQGSYGERSYADPYRNAAYAGEQPYGDAAPYGVLPSKYPTSYASLKA